MFWVPLNISRHLFRCLAESRPSGRNGRERERERPDCYWFGSLDFNFLVEVQGFSTIPTKSDSLFAVRPATKRSHPFVGQPHRESSQLQVDMAKATAEAASLEAGERALVPGVSQRLQHAPTYFCMGWYGSKLTQELDHRF